VATEAGTTAVIRRILQITASAERLTDAEIVERKDDALDILSKDKPRVLREEYIGNSEHERALPASWVADFSQMTRLEWPGGSQFRDFEDQNDIEVVRTDTTERAVANVSSGATTVTLSAVADAGYFKDGEIVTIKDDDATETNWITADGNATSGVVTIKNAAAALYDATPLILKLDHITFKTVEPSSSDYFVIEYTGQHVLTATADSIPVTDYNAFTHLAAALCAESIAADFAKSTDSNLSGDDADYLSNSEAWRNIAEDKMRIYDKHMGKTGERIFRPVLVTREVDATYSWGRSFLYHGQRTR